jgi:hypothetical protein
VELEEGIFGSLPKISSVESGANFHVISGKESYKIKYHGLPDGYGSHPTVTDKVHKHIVKHIKKTFGRAPTYIKPIKESTMKPFARFLLGEALDNIGVSGYNKPKRTPSHPTKSHVVVAKSGDKTKTIRFGQQGVSGAGKDPKKS